MDPAAAPQIQRPHFLRGNSMPLTWEGRVTHLDLGPGEVANNVVTVGSESRATTLAKLLDGSSGRDGGPAVTTHRSKRGFVTHTGKYNGVPVSIILINMGYPNIDFLVREVREVTEGPLRIVRLGSCAALRQDISVGSVAVATEGSILVRQNPDAWGGDGGAEDMEYEGSSPCYTFHGVVLPNEELTRALLVEMETEMGEGNVVACLNVTGESFYSSQGRADPNFNDHNEDIIQEVASRYPSAGSMEMESFHLLHLAHLCRKSTLHAATAALVLANRAQDSAIVSKSIDDLERKAGLAVLKAITCVSTQKGM
ncbi:unnamed protein product [Discosporangium mesarthrocarpum]